jgi:hypothetical protein
LFDRLDTGVFIFSFLLRNAALLSSNVSQKMLLKISTKLMGALRIAEKNFYLGCMPVKTIISFTELMVTNLAIEKSSNS